LLQKIIRYCETDVCRRKLLLEYFGENYQKEICHNCDNCLMAESEKDDLTIPVQKFLSCIWRTGELFGVNYIINVLRGSNEKKILANNHDTLSTYNIGNELSKKQWMELFSKLISAGIIRREPQHGSLKLTPKAWLILKGKAAYLGKLTIDDKPAQTKSAVPEYDEELFQQLRQVRKKLADEKNVPAFVILPDRSLQEMAYYLPQSAENMQTLYGIGDVKARSYAPVFLPVISQYATAHNKPEIEKEISIKRDQRFKEVGGLFNKGKTIPEIAGLFGVQEKTILNHLVTCLQQNFELVRMPEAADNFPPITELEPIIERLKELDSEFLKPVFESFERKISYETIRLAQFIYLLQQQKAIH
jgi:ATP-dependent DNA helicase RecQ